MIAGRLSITYQLDQHLESSSTHPLSPDQPPPVDEAKPPETAVAHCGICRVCAAFNIDCRGGRIALFSSPHFGIYAAYPY